MAKPKKLDSEDNIVIAKKIATRIFGNVSFDVILDIVNALPEDADAEEIEMFENDLKRCLDVVREHGCDTLQAATNTVRLYAIEFGDDEDDDD